jgi:hypothetical protein
VRNNRERTRFDTFHDLDWRRLHWRGHNKSFDGEVGRPPQLDRFISMAERIAAGFDHLRVDLFEWRGEAHFGELTLYSHSGLIDHQPEEAALLLGSWWTLRSPVRRALRAMLSF